MYQNNVIYADDLIIEFTQVTLIVSDVNSAQCGTGCNESDSWIFDIDLGPDLEYITSGTQYNARWKVEGGWSIHLGPPASRILTSWQNYLIRTESIGGVVTPTVCNKTNTAEYDLFMRR